MNMAACPHESARTKAETVASYQKNISLKRTLTLPVHYRNHAGCQEASNSAGMQTNPYKTDKSAFRLSVQSSFTDRQAYGSFHP